MAEGVNILINDGGAPARIMKLGLAAADMDAGLFVTVNSAGKVSAADLHSQEVGSTAVGILFVDAVSGEPASVITGSGLMCYLKGNDAIAAGVGVNHDGDGRAVTATTADDEVLAVSLEAKDATHSGFTKVLLR